MENCGHGLVRFRLKISTCDRILCVSRKPSIITYYFNLSFSGAKKLPNDAGQNKFNAGDRVARWMTSLANRPGGNEDISTRAKRRDNPDIKYAE